MRVRLFYEKRGFACFVPHVALSAVFTRAAGRAGLAMLGTEGFTRRPRISFGPELPAGVIALNEPVDMWPAADFLLPFWDPKTLNAQMPEGFRVTKCLAVPDGAPALGKDCGAAHYLAWTVNALPAEELLVRMKRHYGPAILSGAVETDEMSLSMVSVTLANPAQNGIGGLVKSMAAEGSIGGWHDMRVVRTALGRWNGNRMELMQDAKK